MGVPYSFPRGSRPSLDLKAAGGSILTGQAYLLTDESRIAVGLSPSTYAAMVKDSDVETVGPAANLPNREVSPSVLNIHTSEPGSPLWRYRADASTLTATIPGAVIFDKTGRGFVLDELIVTPEHFGAAGDGVTNDTTAMQRLAKFINWRGGGVIAFRGGATYVVGRQTTQLGTGPAYVEEQVLAFSSCDGVLIMGNGAKLRNAAGLHYGSFNPTTGLRHDAPAGGFANVNYRASLGHIMQFTNCTRVALQDMRIDGNSDNLIIGGYYGDKGYQIPGDCLRFTTSSFIRLSNLELVNAPHDGLYLNIKGNTPIGDVELQGSFLAENLFIDRNGRQGCSITGGSGLMFRNCRFNRSGQGQIHSAPMAGCDVEPVDRWASEITFEQCQFIANGGVGLINDSGQTGRVVVRRCEIWGGFDGTQGGLTVNGGHAILIDHAGWVVEDTEIHGTTPTIFDDTVFRNCKWDKAIHPVYGQSGTNQTALLTTNGGKFYDCTFEIPKDLANSSIWSPGCQLAVRCNFNFGGVAGAAVGMGVLGNCVYENCNFNGLWPVNRTGPARPQFGVGGSQFSPTFIGVNRVSGDIRVNNYFDCIIPATAEAATGLKTWRATDTTVTDNSVYTEEYRLAPPTSGFYRVGSVVRNRANALGVPSRWECTTIGAIGSTAWAANTIYVADQVVTNDNGRSYVCTSAGVSADTGGPTGTSAAIVDGTVTWRYYAAFVFTPFEYDVPGVTIIPAGTAALSVVASTKNTLRWTGNLLANRTATLSATGAIQGRRYRFVRSSTSTGAFTVAVIDGVSSATLKELNTGDWCEAEFDGTNWVLIGAGTGV